MFRIGRRPVAELGVRFCDECVEVTTSRQRAQRQYDRGRADVQAWGWLR